jgi:hypothetical protein
MRCFISNYPRRLFRRRGSSEALDLTRRWLMRIVFAERYDQFVGLSIKRVPHNR